LPSHKFTPEIGVETDLKPTWTAKFNHVNGTQFTRELNQLIDFSLSDEAAIQNFAGDIIYSAQFENSEDVRYIKLTEVNQAVTTLAINGNTVGTKWYGNHIYDVGRYLKKGKNTVEITLTTTLVNYCRSLSDNPTAQRWTRTYKTPFSSGLEGVVFTK
jgi:hypothetical protein